MGIRSRTVVLIAATGIVLWVVLLGAGILVGDRASNGIDRAGVVNTLVQAKAVVRYDADKLGTIAADWATWDDTYRFVRDHDRAYVRSNLMGNTLPNLGVDFMLFVDGTDKVGYTAAVDPVSHAACAPPTGILRYLRHNPSVLHSATDEDGASGVIATPKGDFVIAVRPITTTDAKAPANGTFVVGYRLDARKATDIRRLTMHPVALLSSAAGARASRAAPATLPDGSGLAGDLVVISGSDTLTGYSAIPGIDGQPAAMIAVTTPRGAFTVTRSVVLSAGSALGLIGMVLALVLAVTLDKTILNRLAHLSSAVSNIGSSRDVEARLPVVWDDEISGLASDINGMLDELGQAHSELEFLAVHDPLTLLYNRRHFEDELERELAEYKRFGTPGAVLWLDLDHFKDVNDSLGHAAGDELLIKFAEQLKEQNRSYCTLARLGGDEFGILIPHAERSQAVSAASRLVKTLLATTFEGGDHKVRISTSIGVVLFPDHGETVSDLLSHADLAMYDAKAKGGNQLVVYDHDESWRTDMTSRIEMAENIVAALRDDRLMLYAQPVMDLSGRHGQAYELLLRMVGDDGRIIVPDQIIPTAERLGIIRDIDRWVARKGIQLLAEAKARGDDVFFGVNMSGCAFSDDTLLQLMREEFAATGADPARLVIEITETTAIANIEAARRFILALKEIGCRFSLDDFGSGSSSFYYLKHLPIDFLKIDGSIVVGSATGAADIHFLRAIVEMCRGLNIRTVAEYVENADLLDLVTKEGVDFAQGYEVGRPEPIDTYFATDAKPLAPPRLFAAPAVARATA